MANEEAIYEIDQLFDGDRQFENHSLDLPPIILHATQVKGICHYDFVATCNTCLPNYIRTQYRPDLTNNLLHSENFLNYVIAIISTKLFAITTSIGCEASCHMLHVASQHRAMIRRPDARRKLQNQFISLNYCLKCLR